MRGSSKFLLLNTILCLSSQAHANSALDFDEKSAHNSINSYKILHEKHGYTTLSQNNTTRHNSPPPITQPGTGVGYIKNENDKSNGELIFISPQPQVSITGTGTGYASPQIVRPGIGVGYTRYPPQITYPGTGVGYVLSPTDLKNYPEIVNPGTGVSYIVIRKNPFDRTPVADPALERDYIVLPNYGGIYKDFGSAGVAAGYMPAQIQEGASGLGGTAASANSSSAFAALAPFPAEIAELSYLDLDSNLRDCHIPFDQLQSKSPFCVGDASDSLAKSGKRSQISQLIKAEGRLCQRFSYSQFPEVLMLQVVFEDKSREYCTATLIANNWALTAAHCFLGNNSANLYGGNDQKDVVWRPGNDELPFKAAVVDAINMKLAALPNRRREAAQVIINGRYAGKDSKPQFSDDLALIRLAAPFREQEAIPAALAREFSAEATLAGTGFTNADGASNGNYNMGWPPSLSQVDGQISFEPVNAKDKSAFCQGDSGGPVFVGRLRGCKKGDVYPEIPPHRIQGVISYNMLGAVAEDASTEAQQASSACVDASHEFMQDITLSQRRQWICRVTANTPIGCR